MNFTNKINLLNFASIFFVPVVILIRLIKPFIHIRWIKSSRSDRIGIFFSGIEHYLSLRDFNSEKNKKTIDLFYFNFISNEYLLEKLNEKIIILNSILIRLLVQADKIVQLFIGKNNTHEIDNEITSKDLKGLVHKYAPHIEFTQHENEEGKKFLKNLGVQRDEKYLCLLVRDSAYLNEYFPGRDWSYHSYRDSNIKNYSNGIKYLLDEGYWIIRMGKTTNQKLDISHERLIDYSLSEYKSDFFDIWLMANCYFCISTGAGLDEVARVFKIPTLYINYWSILDWKSFHQSVTFPKYIKYKDSKKSLSFSEYLDFSFIRTEEYEKKNIEILELSSKDIKDAMMEMHEMVNNKWILKSEDLEIQKKFQTIIQKHLNMREDLKKLHGFIHPNSIISSKFLEKHKDWFL